MSRLRSGPLRSILILQTKHIGDLVLSTTLASNLQLEYPGVRIVILCDGRFASFLTANDVASEVVTFRRSHMRGTPLRRAQELILTLLKLRRSHFDMVVDITDTKTSRFISGLVGAPVRVGYIHPKGRRVGSSANLPTSRQSRSAMAGSTSSIVIFRRWRRLA